MDTIYIITTMAEQNATIDPTAHSTLNAVQVASLLIGVFIPILVGLVTKVSTNAALKSVLLLALSCVSGFLTEFINSNNFIWQQALLTSVITFVIGVATYYGLWTPTGVTAKAQGALISDTNGSRGSFAVEHAITGTVLLTLVLIIAWMVTPALM